MKMNSTALKSTFEIPLCVASTEFFCFAPRKRAQSSHSKTVLKKALYGKVGALIFCAFLCLISTRSWAQLAVVLGEMSPKSGSTGTIVMITGEKFGAAQGTSSVQFDGVLAPVQRWSDTSLVVEVPAVKRLGSVDVLVTITGVKQEHLGSFTVVEPNHLTPTEGPAGTLVTINGAGFGSTQGASRVYFGKKSADGIRLWSEEQIALPAPDTGNPAGSLVEVTVHKGGVVRREGDFMLIAEKTAPPSPAASEANQLAQKPLSANQPALAAAVTASPDKPPANATAGVDPQQDSPDAKPAPPKKTIEGIDEPAGPSAEGGASDPPAGSAPAGGGAVGGVDGILPPTITISPSLAVAGTQVIIKCSSSSFGDYVAGKSIVKFGSTVATVNSSNWTPGQITLNAPDLGVAGEPNSVMVSVFNADGNELHTADGQEFVENPSTWGDKDERPLDIKFVGGYEEGFQSSQAATSDAFLAIYGRRLFVNDHIGPYFGVRLQTAPQASNTYNVFSVLANPSGQVKTSDLNSVGAAVDLSIGLEYQFLHLDKNERTSLGLIAGGGFITPLQSNSIAATFNMPAFGTVECTGLQSRLKNVLAHSSYQGIVPNTVASSSSCFSNILAGSSSPVPIMLLEYATPDTPNFFPKYSIGLRIVNRYPETVSSPQSCLENSPCERGYVDFTVGQSAALTGGSLKHTVFTIDSIHPLPVPTMNFIYLFGSASKRFYKLPASLDPLVLTPGTASTGPTGGTLVIPLTQPDRDFYRIGVGVNITQIFKGLTNKSSQ